MIHLAEQKTPAICAGIRMLAREVIDDALEDLTYHKGNAAQARKVRRSAESFFNPKNPDSSLSIMASFAELDEEMLRKGAIDKIMNRCRI